MGKAYFLQITMEMAQAWLVGIGKISFLSYKVEAIPPHPLDVPRDIEDIAPISQALENIFQYLLAMPISFLYSKNFS